LFFLSKSKIIFSVVIKLFLFVAGMDALDSDKALLQAGGKVAERDIVQFVA
jgi:hypothetical protein